MSARAAIKRCVERHTRSCRSSTRRRNTAMIGVRDQHFIDDAIAVVIDAVADFRNARVDGRVPLGTVARAFVVIAIGVRIRARELRVAAILPDAVAALLGSAVIDCWIRVVAVSAIACRDAVIAILVSVMCVTRKVCTGTVLIDAISAVLTRRRENARITVIHIAARRAGTRAGVAAVAVAIAAHAARKFVHDPIAVLVDAHLPSHLADLGCPRTYARVRVVAVRPAAHFYVGWDTIAVSIAEGIGPVAVLVNAIAAHVCGHRIAGGVLIIAIASSER